MGLTTEEKGHLFDSVEGEKKKRRKEKEGKRGGRKTEQHSRRYAGRSGV